MPPRLDDPGELENVKRIYGFEDHNPIFNDIDPIELNERMEAKAKTNKNQAR